MFLGCRRPGIVRFLPCPWTEQRCLVNPGGRDETGSIFTTRVYQPDCAFPSAVAGVPCSWTAGAEPCGSSADPLDQVTTLWSNKMGLESGSGGKRGRRLWMSEGLMLLQLDPLDHHFDPEGQAPTLWTRTSWSTGSVGLQM
jgi:hypothetical protein